MSEVLERTAETQTKLRIIDSDIHPGFSRGDEIMPFLATRWHDYVRTFGGLYRQALAETLSHPRMAPAVARADSWPPNGAQPGSDLAFVTT